MDIRLPKLTSYQKEVWDWLGDCKGSGKIAVIRSVRQSGKSFFCQLKLIEQSLLHIGTSVIFEPSLSQARNMFKQICKMMDGSGAIRSANAQTLELEFINGSSILFKSTEQSNRGYTVTNLLVLDECAYLDDEEIYTLLPLVNANNAPIIIASTPFTMDGYYYNMYLIGEDGNNDNVRSFNWAKEKEIGRFLTEERKMFYKQTMSRMKYQTEVLGEFLSSDGLLFSNLVNCINATPSFPRSCFIGIDFASGSEGDYTVLSVFNDKGEQYALYRTNNLSPMQQVDWIAEILKELDKKTTIRRILAEKNSIGAVYIDALNKKVGDIRITPWNTSNDSKQDLVTTFQIALENNQATVLKNEVLLNELRKYEAEISPNSKVIRYNGKNCHDDCVMATMLSYYAYKKNFGTYSFSF